MLYFLRFISPIVLSVVFLSNCTATVGTAAVATGVAVAQNRTVGDAVDDSKIWTEIKHNFLQKDIKQLLIAVDVKVKEGRVLLTGNVDNQDNRITATRLAWKPEGVKEVINEVQVNEKHDVKTYAKDTLITTQVKSKLLLNRDIRSINYNIETVNGIVYVFGIANNKRELEDVANITSRISGLSA